MCGSPLYKGAIVRMPSRLVLFGAMSFAFVSACEMDSEPAAVEEPATDDEAAGTADAPDEPDAPDAPGPDATDTDDEEAKPAPTRRFLKVEGTVTLDDKAAEVGDEIGETGACVHGVLRGGVGLHTTPIGPGGPRLALFLPGGCPGRVSGTMLPGKRTREIVPDSRPIPSGRGRGPGRPPLPAGGPGGE